MTTVEIRSPHMEITDAMRAFVDKRATLALSRHGDQLQSAQLWVHDINGPRGGNDMHCLLAFVDARIGRLVVEATDASFYTAVDRVMKRATQARSHALGRQRTSDRTLPRVDSIE
jgi:putative sigma-54 modulation protein